MEQSCFINKSLLKGSVQTLTVPFVNPDPHPENVVSVPSWSWWVQVPSAPERTEPGCGAANFLSVLVGNVFENPSSCGSQRWKWTAAGLAPFLLSAALSLSGLLKGFLCHWRHHGLLRKSIKSVNVIKTDYPPGFQLVKLSGLVLFHFWPHFLTYLLFLFVWTKGLSL